MQYFKQRICALPMIVIAILFGFGILSTPSTTKAATNGTFTNYVVDNHGDHVQVNKNYKVKVQLANGLSAGSWKMYVSGTNFIRWVGFIQDNWADSFQFINIENDKDGFVQEEARYKMVLGGDGQYLYYQKPTLFYPNGGIYLGEQYGSINFTLKKTTTGYTMKADDGPLYADPNGTGDMISNKNSTAQDFSVSFLAN